MSYRDRQIGESYKDYAARMAGDARAAEIDRDCALAALTALHPPQTDGPHVYLSTACLHGEHNYCTLSVGSQGEKRPATCKFCDVRCTCTCHAVAPSETDGGEHRG